MLGLVLVWVINFPQALSLQLISCTACPHDLPEMYTQALGLSLGLMIQLLQVIYHTYVAMLTVYGIILRIPQNSNLNGEQVSNNKQLIQLFTRVAKKRFLMKFCLLPG